MTDLASATLKYALTSDKKLTLMAKLVRGKKVKDALDTLEFIPKRTAKILHKLIKSALSNAISKGMKFEELYIKEMQIGRGPKLKRIRFASRSRIAHYIKHRAFIKVVLLAK